MNEKAEASSLAVVSKCFEVTAEEKAQWAKRFIESGLSFRKFSAQYGLPRMSLWRWVSQSKESSGHEPGSRGGFARAAFTEIKLPAPVACSNWAAELSLPNGIILRVAPDAPAALLEQLLRVC